VKNKYLFSIRTCEQSPWALLVRMDNQLLHTFLSLLPVTRTKLEHSIHAMENYISI